MHEDEISEAARIRFRDIWTYCLTLHPGVGTLPGGPCNDCVNRYAVSGPPATLPDGGKWKTNG